MNALYHFVAGPLVWIAFIVFIGGSLFRLGRMLALVHQKEKFIYAYMSLKYSLRSIGHWLLPFGTVNMRRQPVMTIVTFAFHICLFIAPLFALGHAVLIQQAWGVDWWFLPDAATDEMTLVVIGGCLFFLIRRIKRPEVNYLTSPSDYVLLALVALPFITGFLAYHQWVAYRAMLVLHILSGEVMLMIIPFTRLSHMLFSPFTRAYTGSEFGKIRHARDW